MTNPSLNLYLRQKFEELPEFKHLLELCEWDDAERVYVNKSGDSDFEYYADGCNGGLTAFICQQHKIEELKSQLEKYEKPDHIETVNNVEVILERLTFHIFEEVLIWSNEHASKSFTRCVKKTVEEFKSGKLILTKGYPQLKCFQVDNVITGLNTALGQSQDHQDNLYAEIQGLKEKLAKYEKFEGCVVVPEDQAKDTARLDFMLAKGRIISEKTNYNECYKPIATGLCVCDVYWIDGMDRLTESLHQTDREAIDAAMENHNV